MSWRRPRAFALRLHVSAAPPRGGLTQALGLTTAMPDLQTIAIALLTPLIGGSLLLYVHGKNARRAATVKYRAALLETFAGLYPIPTNWPDDIDAHLRQVFPLLQRAADEFRPYIPRYSQRSYDTAWFNYRLGPDGREIDKQLYHQYMGFTSPGKPIIDPKETFRNNVAALLAFASET